MKVKINDSILSLLKLPKAGFLLFALIHFPLNAQGKAPDTIDKTRSAFDNPVFAVMFSTVILLMLAIIVFAHVAKIGIQFRREQDRAKRDGDYPMVKIMLLLFSIGGFSNTLISQEATSSAVKAVKSNYFGMDATTFYLLAGMIVFEALIACKLYAIAMEQLGVRERRQRIAEARKKERALVKRPSIMEKLNNSVAVEKEADIMLDHDYDGIRELDNNLPPWWKYGFYLTIIFSVIYLFRFHVVHTGKLQLAEYDQQLLEAKYEMEAYRKKAANLVDENNATLLTDNASLASGRSIFTTNCVACHGNAGEGGVGPNLTDDYWLHGADIKDVFRTIKYGYPEKGMKSWKQDLGAKQIHEIASYIKSLSGTNPPNAKEPEGEFVSSSADTLKVAQK